MNEQGFQRTGCACAILAAGHGQIGGKPKLLASLGQESVIAYVVRLVKQAGNFSPIVVVLNPKTEQAFRSELARGGHTDLVYANQDEPWGMPNAVFHACLVPEMRDIEHIIMVPGDCPLWLPKTLNVLWREHISPRRHQIVPSIKRTKFPCPVGEQKASDVTALTFPYDPDHELAGFVAGRSFLNGEMMIHERPMCVLNQGDKFPLPGSELTTGLAVFRKSWVISLQALFEANREVETNNRHPEGTALPTLLNRFGVTVTNVTGNFDYQVLDINTGEHLELARRVVAHRSS